MTSALDFVSAVSEVGGKLWTAGITPRSMRVGPIDGKIGVAVQVYADDFTRAADLLGCGPISAKRPDTIAHRNGVYAGAHVEIWTNAYALVKLLGAGNVYNEPCDCQPGCGQESA